MAHAAPVRVEFTDEDRCPLTLLGMRQPVIASDGRAYELEAIEKHRARPGALSPITRMTYGDSNLVVNEAIKNRIEGKLGRDPSLLNEVYCPYNLFEAMEAVVRAKDLPKIRQIVITGDTSARGAELTLEHKSTVHMRDKRLLVRSPLEMYSVFWAGKKSIDQARLSNRNAFELACELDDASYEFIVGMMQLIQELDPNYLRDHRPPAGWNPVALNKVLHRAAWEGNYEHVELALNFGANIESESNMPYSPYEGQRALHISAVSGHLAIVRLLLDRRALIDATDERGLTAFHLAVYNRITPPLTWQQRLPVLNLLIERGADSTRIVGDSSDILNLCGYSPLHLAADKLDCDAAQFLLNLGRLPVDAKTPKGETPLYKALNNGKDINSLEVRQMVALLMEFGANPRVRQIPENEANAKLLGKNDAKYFAMGSAGIHTADRWKGIARVVDELQGEQISTAYIRTRELGRTVAAQAREIAVLKALLVEVRPDLRARLGLPVEENMERDAPVAGGAGAAASAPQRAPSPFREGRVVGGAAQHHAAERNTLPTP